MAREQVENVQEAAVAMNNAIVEYYAKLETLREFPAEYIIETRNASRYLAAMADNLTEALE